METASDKQLVSMLQGLVEEKEGALRRLSLLESVLARNSIYFVAFEPDERILYHNIPDRSDLLRLEDCAYILERENLEKIRGFLPLAEEEAFEVTLKSQVLAFTLYTQEEFPGLFFLQITLFNQGSGAGQAGEEGNLDRAKTGLEDIQTALTLLDEIRSMDPSERKESLNREIREHYIAGLDRLRKTVQDPIVSLCLEIIQKNLEEFLSPAGSLSQLYKVLTPSEIQVAEFIRMGKTSKDIADALDIAQKTVENHRNKVRDKLGLRNKGVNLRSYLMQLEG